MKIYIIRHGQTNSNKQKNYIDYKRRIKKERKC